MESSFFVVFFPLQQNESQNDQAGLFTGSSSSNTVGRNRTTSTFSCYSGESVDDCGGGYSESIAEMCDELQNGSLPLLIVTPNGRDESGANRDCFLLNPSLVSPLQQNMFRFLGELS